MDCFSVINVPDSYIVTVRGTAVENLLVADQKDIPAYLGFLLGVEEPALLSTVRLVRVTICLFVFHTLISFTDHRRFKG